MSLGKIINSLWLSDAIWLCRSGSTLVQVMACCLTVPSHYPNQCWLIIRSTDIHPRAISERIQQPSITEIILKITSKISFKSPKGQWVNVHIQPCTTSTAINFHYAPYLLSTPAGCRNPLYKFNNTTRPKQNRRYCLCTRHFNTLWPSDAIWRHGSGSTLAQVMAWCLTAPSHYLIQCWFVICRGLWHSSEVIVIRKWR